MIGQQRLDLIRQLNFTHGLHDGSSFTVDDDVILKVLWKKVPRNHPQNFLLSSVGTGKVACQLSLFPKAPTQGLRQVITRGSRK